MALGRLLLPLFVGQEGQLVARLHETHLDLLLDEVGLPILHLDGQRALVSAFEQK